MEGGEQNVYTLPMENVFNAKLANGKESKVWFTQDLLEMQEKINALGSNILIVTDENTERYTPNKEKTVVLQSGEEHKNWESLDKILSTAIESGMARDSVFVAIGGGVVCDMTALASALYMRGAKLMLCPTTLLSMVDASVGGKAAIDYHGTKNTVGAFYPAEDIIICLETLKTLSDDQYMCGMGEVVKHAFLADTEELYNFLHSSHDAIMARDLASMHKMVKLSLEVKKNYVERDPMEQHGIRSVLNFGHTFGHALESVSNYGVSHGEAVVWGMKKALTAGLFLGVTPQDFYLWAIDLIALYPFKADFKVKRSEGEAFLAATKKDKKKSNGTTKFVLLKGLGDPLLTPLSDEQVTVMAL